MFAKISLWYYEQDHYKFLLNFEFGRNNVEGRASYVVKYEYGTWLLHTLVTPYDDIDIV